MKMRSMLWLIVLLTLKLAVVSGQTLTSKDASPGQSVTINGSFDGNGPWKIAFKAVDEKGSEIPNQPPIGPVAAKVADDKKSLSFTLPPTFKEGSYKLTVESGQDPNLQNTSVGDTLKVSKSAAASPSPVQSPAASSTPAKSPEPAVTITAVLAQSRYPVPAHGNGYDFEIDGTNFSKTLEENHVSINGSELSLNTKCTFPFTSASENRIKSASDNQTNTNTNANTNANTRNTYNGCLRADAGKLVVEGYQPGVETTPPLKVSVRVGDGNIADAPSTQTLSFSRISKDALRVYAIGSFLLIIGVLFLLVRTGVKLRKRDDASFNSLMAFLIDKDTNSYSLSKFQLTLFTLVTIFGYIYIFVCRLFVQWKFELPPIPENLPTMLAVSVGTTVAAAGIGAQIGGKGGGAESPTLADLVSSGGVVLGERFQFFLWSIVSSMGVLAIILASDPATIDQLPKIPEGMLYLMGLSSAGYLGGKLVRGPGPNIKSIDVKNSAAVDVKGQPLMPAAMALVATLTGDNLSPSSTTTFQLDDERIPSGQVTIIGQKVDDQHPQFCSMMVIQLRSVAERYLEGPHVFRIMNPDGQGAEITYGTKIDSATKIDQAAGAARIKLSVKGMNFKDPSQGSWVNDVDPQPGNPAIPVDAVRKVSDTEIEVTLPEGATLPGKLTVTSPGNLKTTVDAKP
jgi:hypothetical protein